MNKEVPTPSEDEEPSFEVDESKDYFSYGNIIDGYWDNEITWKDCAKLGLTTALIGAAIFINPAAALAGALGATPRSGGGRLGGRRLERRGGQLARRGGHRPGLRGRWL